MAAKAELKLLTPCCSAPIDPDTEWGGHTAGEIVVGYSCAACLNSWDREGNQITFNYALEEA